MLDVVLLVDLVISVGLVVSFFTGWKSPAALEISAGLVVVGVLNVALIIVLVLVVDAFAVVVMLCALCTGLNRLLLAREVVAVLDSGPGVFIVSDSAVAEVDIVLVVAVFVVVLAGDPRLLLVETVLEAIVVEGTVVVDEAGTASGIFIRQYPLPLTPISSVFRADRVIA